MAAPQLWQSHRRIAISALLRAARKGPANFAGSGGADIVNHGLQHDLLTGVADAVFEINRIIDFGDSPVGFHGPASAAAPDLHQHRTIWQHRSGDLWVQVEPDYRQIGNFPRGPGIFQRIGPPQIGAARLQIQLAVVKNTMRRLKPVM